MMFISPTGLGMNNLPGIFTLFTVWRNMKTFFTGSPSIFDNTISGNCCYQLFFSPSLQKVTMKITFA